MSAKEMQYAPRLEDPNHGSALTATQQRLTSRSNITVEDLKTKTGTTVNGEKFKGETRVLTNDVNEILMGGSPDVFRYATMPRNWCSELIAVAG